MGLIQGHFCLATSMLPKSFEKEESLSWLLAANGVQKLSSVRFEMIGFIHQLIIVWFSALIVPIIDWLLALQYQWLVACASISVIGCLRLNISDWLLALHYQWLVACASISVIGCLRFNISDWLLLLLIDCLSLHHWLIGFHHWPIGFHHWLIVYLIDWFNHWLIVYLIDWFHQWLIPSLIVPTIGFCPIRSVEPM